MTDGRTINQHLSSKVATGNEKVYQGILTDVEEKILVKYLINKNRVCQGLSGNQVEGVVLNILQVLRERNRKGGKSVKKLSRYAKEALEKMFRKVFL